MSPWQDASLGGTVAVSLALAVLLGLRHATDPDHLTAVATLMISEKEGGAARAGWLGMAWGLGHATALFLFGLPVVLLGRALPAVAHEMAELAVGGIIVLLALRLLLRWRRGYFHTHPHEHDGKVHSHPHFHDHAATGTHAEHPRPHLHEHTMREREPLAAFGVGLVHGVGGSAGAGVVLIAAITQRAEAMAALLAFAGATALSMAIVSAGAGHLLARGRRLSGYVERAVPMFGLVSLGVGVWYAVMALRSLRP